MSPPPAPLSSAAASWTSASPRASRSSPSASLHLASRLSLARYPSAPARPSPRARAKSSPGSAAPGGGQRSDGGASFLDDGLPALSGSLRTLRGLLTWIGTKSTVRLLMSLKNIEREVAARLRPLPRAPGIRGPRRPGSPTPPALGSGAGRGRGAGRAG